MTTNRNPIRTTAIFKAQNVYDQFYNIALDHLESSDIEIADIKFKINQSLSVLDTVIEKLNIILPIASLLDQDSPEQGLDKILELFSINKQHPTVLKHFENLNRSSKRMQYRDLYGFLCNNISSLQKEISSAKQPSLIDGLEKFKLRMRRNMRLLGQFEQQMQDYLHKIAQENKLLKEMLEVEQRSLDKMENSYKTIFQRVNDTNKLLIQNIKKLKKSQSMERAATIKNWDNQIHRECVILEKEVQSYSKTLSETIEKYNKQLRDDAEKELEMIGKKHKRELNLKNWLEKYDQEVGALGFELDDLQDELAELEIINADIRENKINPQEDYYLECMAQQEEWDRETRKKIRLEVLKQTACARIIQRWYRRKKEEQKNKKKKKPRAKKRLNQRLHKPKK